MAKKVIKTDLDTLTGVQQIAVLGRLNQAAAAALLGWSGRQFRDYPTAPRNPDGTYDAPALVAWARNCKPVPEIDDDAIERLLLAVDEIYSLIADVTGVTILDTFRALHDKHGPAALVAAFEVMLERWGELYEADPPDMSPLTREKFRADENERFERAVAQEQYDRLDVSVICDDCGRLRHGRKWSRAKPPVGRPVTRSICDDCGQKLRKAV